MPFGLTIGTERAVALQNAIQDELIKRGYSPDADPVMAEYITIMIINNKTAAQITSELEDLIGTDFDHSFTDWLFTEAAKGASPSDTPSHTQPSSSSDQTEPTSTRDAPPHIPSDSSRRLPSAPRNVAPIYQQALSQALPGASPATKKRAASARSPSPGSSPNKSRRTTDLLPTGPRAMIRDGNSSNNPGSRSLLERVGGPAPPAGSMRNGNVSGGGVGGRFPRDDIQARIDSITGGPSPDPLAAGFPPSANGMGDMAALGMGMANPLILQEMMMNNMALMAQMASSMGLLGGGGPPVGQFPGGPPFPMQGVISGDMGVYQQGGGMNHHGFPGPSQHQQYQQRGGINGGGRGGRGMGRGRGGRPPTTPKATEDAAPAPTAAPQATIATPTPIPASAVPSNPAPPTNPANSTATAATVAAPAAAAATSRPGFVVPERPQSPTLCKFGLKCTNAHCRFSHPSPVATAESGVVLSNEACEQGKDCKDKDCIKAHVSPAVLTNTAAVSDHYHQQQQQQQHLAQQQQPPNMPSSGTIACRFGSACTRPNCPFLHPTRGVGTQAAQSHFAQQCRFGAGCTRATCAFQHPPGRVLPTTFHRGLSTSAPLVNVPTPEAGSMGGPGLGGSGISPHRSVTFNHAASGGMVGSGKGGMKELERRVKEAEERKNEAEKAVKEAEAAAGKKDESKVVAITA